jgi:hypothetical protein
MKKSRFDGPPEPPRRLSPGMLHHNWRARPGNEAEQIDDDDDDDIPREKLSGDDIVRALRAIAHHRQKLEDLHRMMDYWREISPDFAAAWHAFTSIGGVTAADYMRWAGCAFRGRRVLMKGQLRLVVSNPVQSFRVLGRYRLKHKNRRK